ncbi:MAG TPA: hypothetical protein VFF85_12095, partial [Microbacterium sp.]|nr:hypothetical protein [Microbacterium sp.]
MHSNDVSSKAPAVDVVPGPDVLHLRRGGTSVVLEMTAPPTIVHWGEDLGEVSPEALQGMALAAAP